MTAAAVALLAILAAWFVGTLVHAALTRRRDLPPVVDLDAARRLRALRRAVERHPSGGAR